MCVRCLQRDLKKFPCKRFREGLCDLGDQCQYLHEDDTVAHDDVHSSTS